MAGDIKRVALGSHWRSKLAQWLHRLAHRVAPPQVEKAASASAPPEHWLAMLRERAPHLLEPGAMSSHFSSTTPPSGAMSSDVSSTTPPTRERSPHPFGARQHVYAESEAPRQTAAAEFSLRGGTAKSAVVAAASTGGAKVPRRKRIFSLFFRRVAPRAVQAEDSYPLRPAPIGLRDQPPCASTPTQASQPGAFRESQERQEQGRRRSGSVRFFTSPERWNASQGRVSDQSADSLVESVEKNQPAESPALGSVHFAQAPPSSHGREDSTAKQVLDDSRRTRRHADWPGLESKLDGSVDLFFQEVPDQPRERLVRDDWQRQIETRTRPASHTEDNVLNPTYSGETPLWPVLPDEAEARAPLCFDGDRLSQAIPPAARDPVPKRDNLHRLASDFKLYCEQQGMAWNGFPF